MNTVRALAVLVTVCIIGPMLLGYCWPTSQEETEQFEVLDGVDITDSVSTDTVPIFTSYTGAFNAAFEWKSHGMGGNVPSYGALTSTQGSLPAYRTSYDSYTPEFLAGPTFTLADLDWPDGTVRGTAVPYSTDGRFTWNGIGFDNLVYFPKTGQGVYLDSDTLATGSIPGSSQISVTGTGVSFWMDEPEPVAVGGDTVPSYADLTQGIRIDRGGMLNGGAWWYNGFVNSGLELLVSPRTDGSWAFIPGNLLTGISVTVSSGTVSVTCAGETVELGSLEAYPFLLLEWDLVTGSASASGVTGMSDFLDPTYQLANTAGFDIPATREFTRMTILTETPGWSASYLVKSTMSQIGTRPGLVDASLDGDGYHPDGDWQLYIRDTSVFGDSISIGGSEFDVTRTGEITVDMEGGGTGTFRIRDLSIMSILEDGERRWFLDGQRILTATDSPSIEFGGAWMADLILYEVDVVPLTLYGWEAGGFGLDVTGFCMAGLMIDVLAFGALVLYGRGAGARVLPLLIACIAIGAVFMTFLMEGF